VTHWPPKRSLTRLGARPDAPLSCKELPISIGRAPTVDRYLDEHFLDVVIGVPEREVHPGTGGLDV